MYLMDLTMKTLWSKTRTKTNKLLFVPGLMSQLGKKFFKIHKKKENRAVACFVLIMTAKPKPPLKSLKSFSKLPEMDKRFKERVDAHSKFEKSSKCDNVSQLITKFEKKKPKQPTVKEEPPSPSPSPTHNHEEETWLEPK